MRFTKMQGAGNDYVYVDCFDEPLPPAPGRTGPPHRRPPFRRRRRRPDPDLPQPAGRRPHADVQRRRLGGGNVRQRHPLRGQVRLRSRPLPQQQRCAIETGRGVLTLGTGSRPAAGSAASASTWASRSSIRERDSHDLAGRPGACTASGGRCRRWPSAAGRSRVTCVSMGNPHCVTFVERVERPTGCWALGPQIETDPHFPQRVNVEFVEVVSPDEVRMRVWERGSGETLPAAPAPAPSAWPAS